MTTEKAHVPNVLATRYASPEMAQIWSSEEKIVLERELWVAVLEGQRALGLDIEDYNTPDALVGLLRAHPEVMNRPVCVRGDQAVIARPAEKVNEILD